MKKITFFTLLFFLSLTVLKAQVCTPDTSIKDPGMYPDSLPDGMAGVTYNETIQFKFPKDTTYSGNTVPIDSVKVYQVDSAPSGFTYQCSNTSCQYPGGGNGCVVFHGNPTSSQVGNYNIRITALAKVSFGGTSFWVPFQDSLPFRIKSSTGIFGGEQGNQNFSIKGNYPNPYGAGTDIVFYSPVKGTVTLKVFDILGNQVYTRLLRTEIGENKQHFDRKGLRAGLYFYSLQMGDKVITSRMMIKD